MNNNQFRSEYDKAYSMNNLSIYDLPSLPDDGNQGGLEALSVKIILKSETIPSLKALIGANGNTYYGNNVSFVRNAMHTYDGLYLENHIMIIPDNLLSSEHGHAKVAHLHTTGTDKFESIIRNAMESLVNDLSSMSTIKGEARIFIYTWSESYPSLVRVAQQLNVFSSLEVLSAFTHIKINLEYDKSVKLKTPNQSYVII